MGWQQVDPEQIFSSVVGCLEGVLNQGFTADSISSFGLTNQRETTIVWNRTTGKAYHDAIIWADTRTEDIAQTMITQHGQNVFQKQTGLPISTYFSALKIKWLLDHCAEFRHDLQTTPESVCIGTVDAWLLFKLTGEFKTDISNASRTLLFNLNTMTWDKEICAFFGIDRPDLCLPKVYHNTHHFGDIHHDLPYGGIKINGCVGDQQASLLGFGCLDYAQTKCTYGTGCFLLMNTGSSPVYSEHGLLTTVGFKLSPFEYDAEQNIVFDVTANKTTTFEDPSHNPGDSVHYALEGSVAHCGSLFQWLIDSMRVASSPQEICEFAIDCSENADLIIIPAFTGLLSPHWCLDARGLIIGLTRYTTHKHLCRSVLESVCMQTRDVVTAMCKDIVTHNTTTGGPLTDPTKIITSLKVDGGVTNSHFLCTFQSGVLDIPVLKAVMQERTALGAAIASGLGSAFYSSIDDVNEKVWKNEDKTPPPTPTASTRSTSPPQPEHTPEQQQDVAAVTTAETVAALTTTTILNHQVLETASSTTTTAITTPESCLSSTSVPSSSRTAALYKSTAHIAVVREPRPTKYHPHASNGAFKIYDPTLHKQSRANALEKEKLLKQLDTLASTENNSNHTHAHHNHHAALNGVGAACEIELVGELGDMYFDFNFERYIKKWASAVERSKGWSTIE